MKTVDQIQRKLTQIIPRLHNKPYEEHLKEPNLLTLTIYRVKGDLIAVSRIFKGFTNVYPDVSFTVDLSDII